MRTGRPGPVHFDMPYDLYMRTAPVSTPDPNVHGQPLNWRTTVADETVEKALSLLAGAQRPLILAGGGVRVAGAYEELQALAEQLDMPVYTSFMGKGALPGRSSAPPRRRRGLGRISRHRSRAQRRRHPRHRRALQRSSHRLVAQGLRLQHPADAADPGRHRPGRDRPQLSGRDRHGRRRQGVPRPGRADRPRQGRAPRLRQRLAEGNRRLAHRLAQFLRALRAVERSADRAAPDDGGDEQDFAARHRDGRRRRQLPGLVGAVLEAEDSRQPPDGGRLRGDGFRRRRRARREARAAQLALRDALRRRRLHDDAACRRDRGRIQSARRLGAAEQLRDRHHPRPAARLSRRPRNRHELRQRAAPASCGIRTSPR